MAWLLQKMPVQTLGLSPLTPLSKLTTHEQKFSARVSPHVSIQRSQLRKLLLHSPWHLVQERTLHVHNFVVRKRQDEVFAPCVNQPKSERVMVSCAKKRISLEVL